MLLGNTPFSSFRYIRCIVCVYRTLGFSSYTSCPCVQLMPVMLNHIHCVQVYAVNILLTRVYQTLISQSHTYWLGNGNSNPLRIHANQINPQTMPQQTVFRFYFFSLVFEFNLPELIVLFVSPALFFCCALPSSPLVYLLTFYS